MQWNAEDGADGEANWDNQQASISKLGIQSKTIALKDNYGVAWFGHPIKEMCPGSFRPLHATECFNYLLVKPLKDRVLAFKSGARAFNLSWPKNGSVSIGGSCV